MRAAYSIHFEVKDWFLPRRLPSYRNRTIRCSYRYKPSDKAASRANLGVPFLKDAQLQALCQSMSRDLHSAGKNRNGKQPTSPAPFTHTLSLIALCAVLCALPCSLALETNTQMKANDSTIPPLLPLLLLLIADHSPRMQQSIAKLQTPSLRLAMIYHLVPLSCPEKAKHAIAPLHLVSLSLSLFCLSWYEACFSTPLLFTLRWFVACQVCPSPQQSLLCPSPL